MERERRRARGRFSLIMRNMNTDMMPLVGARGGLVMVKESTGCLSSFRSLDRRPDSTNLAGYDGSIGSRWGNRTNRISLRPFRNLWTTADTNSRCAYRRGENRRNWLVMARLRVHP